MALALVVCVFSIDLLGEQVIDHPFLGVTHITRTETVPRPMRMHVVLIDLTIPGVRFQLTPPGGTLETVRQTTVDFLNQLQAQVGINGHFFLPFPSASLDAMLIGLAASNGNVYSAFEAPVQSYAIVTNAPAVNIDPLNSAGIVHRDLTVADGKSVVEQVTLWNAVAGSAQIVTNGVKTIPQYLDAQHPDGLLTPGGPANYSNSNSWYDLFNARTSIGLSRDNRTLILFTVDRAGGSQGMSVGEVADLLINDYEVYNALNLDGGGSTTLAMQDPATLASHIVNVSSDNPAGRAVGSNLAVFADLDKIAPTTTVSLSPSPNANGWNRTNTTLTLSSVDNPGGGVQEMQYSLSGAETRGPYIVGSNAMTLLTTEGVTTVRYFATDYSGNQEASKSYSVRIDKTPPVISGTPAKGCSLWPPNKTLVTVATVNATDALSGVASRSFTVTATSSEPASDPNSPDIVITPNGTGFVVQVRADRLASGNGRIYRLNATASDLAGNTATVTASCTVPHDRGN
jgi:hypothetical protein